MLKGRDWRPCSPAQRRHLAADRVRAMTVQRDVRDGPPVGGTLDIRRRHPAAVVVAVRVKVDADQLSRLRMQPVEQKSFDTCWTALSMAIWVASKLLAGLKSGCNLVRDADSCAACLLHAAAGFCG